MAIKNKAIANGSTKIKGTAAHKIKTNMPNSKQVSAICFLFFNKVSIFS
jgi:hypothetical protein